MRINTANRQVLEQVEDTGLLNWQVDHRIAMALNNPSLAGRVLADTVGPMDVCRTCAAEINQYTSINPFVPSPEYAASDKVFTCIVCGSVLGREDE